MNSYDNSYQNNDSQRPNTSTPVKLEYQFLQKSKAGNLLIQQGYQEENQKGTR
jgi:hypothetical protein